MELKREQDEEVNVYLAHLLLLLADPLYQEWVSSYVSKHDTSVYQKGCELSDRVRKYFTYKLNADYLLTSLGIFQNLGKPHGAFRRFYEQEPKIYIGRGKAYYGMAADYNHQIYRRRTTLETVFEKLSFSFEEYVRILSYMRSAYLDFVQSIPDDDFTRFIQQLNSP